MGSENRAPYRNAEAEQEDRTTDHSPADAQPPVSAPVSAPSADQIADQNDCTTEGEFQSRECRDLIAQERMAFWALGAVLLTSLGVVLIWRTLVQTKRAAIYAGRAVDEAEKATAAANASVVETKRIGEAQTRAYVFARKAILQYTGQECRVILTCINTGQTPAPYFRVGCYSYLKSVPAASIDIPADLEYGYWTGLGGGGGKDTVAVHPKDLAAHVGALNIGPSSAVVIVAGRVIYGDVFNDEWESEFAFFIRPVMGAGDYKMRRTVASRLKAYHYRRKSPPEHREAR